MLRMFKFRMMKSIQVSIDFLLFSGEKSVSEVDFAPHEDCAGRSRLGLAASTMATESGSSLSILFATTHYRRGILSVGRSSMSLAKEFGCFVIGLPICSNIQSEDMSPTNNLEASGHSECNGSEWRTSHGVSQPRRLRGLLLSSSYASRVSSPATRERSAPFGKHSRSRPLAFSTCHFSQGWCAAQR